MEKNENKEKTDINTIRARMRMRNAKKRMRVILLLIFAGALIFTVYAADVFFEAEKNSLKESVTVEISGDENIEDIAEKLKDAGAVRHTNVFVATAKMKNLDTGFKKGKYIVPPDSKYTYILRMFLAGNSSDFITIAEGLTREQIFNKISQSGFVSEEKLKDAALLNYDYEFLKGITRENPLEGYLFPETYAIDKNQSARDIINMMLEQFENMFCEEYKTRAEEIGMTVDEVVILASIIQSETTGIENMRLVSDVFSKRLKNGDYLQSCATVQYLLKEKKIVLSAQDIKINSPYNTYMYKGLPIGPICSPGEDAIYAALYPEESDYYYFQSDSKGNMYFSKTFAEHEKKRMQIQEEM